MKDKGEVIGAGRKDCRVLKGSDTCEHVGRIFDKKYSSKKTLEQQT